MKFSPIALALAIAGVFTASQAVAADGTITFTGNVTDTTCVIDGNGTGSPNFAVPLPNVAVSALNSAGARAGQTPFSITVGSAATPCAAPRVKTNFEPGANMDSNTGNLRNVSGTAGNVQVAVLNDLGVTIDLRNNNNSQTVNTASGVAELKYYGEYHATAAASGGDVATTLNYSITYP